MSPAITPAGSRRPLRALSQRRRPSGPHGRRRIHTAAARKTLPPEDKGGDALLQALAPPLLIEGHELHIAASIGISRFPGDGADAETLLKCADLAMYQAKERGRGQWQTFSPALTEAARSG